MEDAIAPPPDQRIAEAERAVVEAAVKMHRARFELTNGFWPSFWELAAKIEKMERLRAERDGRAE